MSIATEITALNNNLAAAKAAVVAKGGTIGDTGLAGLANEIATIPSGSPVGWGSVTYLDANNVEQTVTIQNEDEYLSLGSSTDVTLSIGGASFNIKSITKVDLGVYAGYAPDNFLYNCNKLREITGVNNLLVVGSSFLYNCTSLDCELNFEKLVICGGSFLTQCSALNHQVSFPELHTINDNNFMRQCTAYSYPITFPATLTAIRGSYILSRCNNLTSVVCNCSVTPTDNNSLSTNDNSAIMYTTGVTLTGTYASAWKTALPDRTSSPYRKLILGA